MATQTTVTPKEKPNRSITIHINGKNGARAVEEEFFMREGEAIAKIVVSERVVTQKKIFDSSLKVVSNE